MSSQQRKVATFLSLVIVATMAIFLASLSYEVFRENVRGDRGIGRLFMLTVANSDGLTTMLRGGGALLAIGLALLGRYKFKDWLFYVIVAASVMGAASSIYLFLELSSVDTARNFWAYSPLEELQDYQSFVRATQRGLGWAGAWFVSVLLSELGIKRWSPH